MWIIYPISWKWFFSSKQFVSDNVYPWSEIESLNFKTENVDNIFKD